MSASQDPSVSASSAPASLTSGSEPNPSAPDDVTNVTGCYTDPLDPNTNPLDPNPHPLDDNPVPPERRGIYTFPPTRPFPRPTHGGPIRADQESNEIPFRPDSQVAAIPTRIPALTDQQLAAIQLLLTGHTETSAAEHLNISRMTIWRWKTHHPLFKSELSRRRNETFSAAGDRFRKYLFAALKHLRRQLNDANALTSFRAARCLIYAAGKEHFMPPDDPTEPQAYLDSFALARRKEIHSPNIDTDPATDSERQSALATLLAKCEDPALPPPGMKPAASTPHPLGMDDEQDANQSQGAD